MVLPAFASAQGTELGQEVFRAKCIACHAISCNRIGPKLEDIIGRKVGSVPDFGGYTAEMKTAGFVWSEEKLDKFLADPNATIPGTLMVSAGKLEGSSERQNLIAFLVSGETSLDLCF
jgi:cytochrome c